ncbi:MAG: hypothetical protein QHC67_15735 [Sphingobium sp.]|uniref:DUF2946 family protein n=1 Tax=Sphingobium sp. TaxID=1912891 RepID=UPI0029B74679|nr:DUF2946 family protein [Sphingobium sp.]MDX3911249.1 hypothetical protein [Sphingobium sp.]
MQAIRRLVFDNPKLAGFVLALALALKLVVSAGYMPVISGGQFIVSICSGTGPVTMVMTIPGTGQEKKGGEQPGKAEQPCAFASLSAPLLAAADPLLLASAILFVLALGLRVVVPLATVAPPYLRPPLRGPPSLI